MGGQTQQNGYVWTPTKRRGPIAAEFSSPGPASINLGSLIGSNNANTKQRSPAFTISSRHEHKNNKIGPGPGQYNITKLSHKGKDEAPSPSMHMKPKDGKSFVTPAPGDYCPEKAQGNVFDASPKFSFGIKTENGKASDVPAPNTYNIPSMLGASREGSHESAPAFTMTSRPRDSEDKMKVPGPGTYENLTVDQYKTAKMPAYSMGQKTILPSDHTQKPGPGAHCPEKYEHKKNPIFSFGIKHSEYLGNFNNEM